MPSDNLQIVVHKLEEGDWTTRSNRRQQGKAHKGWVPQVQVAAPPPPQVKNLFGLLEVSASFALTTT